MINKCKPCPKCGGQLSIMDVTGNTIHGLKIIGKCYCCQRCNASFDINKIK